MTEPSTAPVRARDRVRAAMVDEILAAARAELDEEGAATLSLRAVARRLGMAPSALYRYFPSRDSLLTALLVEAYEALGERADEADRAAVAAGAEPMARWLAVCAAARSWAGVHPRRWALLYGSPVPGYAAPEATVESASIFIRVACRITLAGRSNLSAAAVPSEPAAPSGPAGSPALPAGAPPAAALVPPPAGLAPILAPLQESLLPGTPPEIVAGALMAWTSLVGTVSLELFGHYKGATTDFEPVFNYCMEVAGRLAGL